MRTIEKYAIPSGTRLLIAALDNPTRQAILVLLNECPELSFTEIQKTLGLEKHALTLHLKKLLSAALVSRRLKAGTHKYSFYTVTPQGSQILTSLSNAVNQTESKRVKKPRLLNMAGFMAGHGTPEETKEDIDKLREEY
jgi:predicted transcriptional regulator